ncbi:MAG: helix-turn-helix transcriptional regulator [Leucobacter sp.]
MSTGTRALELLGLLQSRRHWPGAELARRLDVSQRTLRRDVAGLQELGYPITTTRGTGGGYQLGPGGSLPPLVLSEDEAAVLARAVARGARIITEPTDLYGTMFSRMLDPSAASTG